MKRTAPLYREHGAGRAPSGECCVAGMRQRWEGKHAARAANLPVAAAVESRQAWHATEQVAAMRMRRRNRRRAEEGIVGQTIEVGAAEI